MTARLIPFRSHERRLSFEDGRSAAKNVLATPIAERLDRSRKLRIDDPELLLHLCETLRDDLQSSPPVVRDEADFFYRFVQSTAQVGLYDERDYFLGQTALLAGIAARHLGKREEGFLWLDRAEAGFRHTMNPAPGLANVAYARLTLRFEMGRYQDVLSWRRLWRRVSRSSGCISKQSSAACWSLRRSR